MKELTKSFSRMLMETADRISEAMGYRDRRVTGLASGL
jgi:hypothetical protein